MKEKRMNIHSKVITLNKDQSSSYVRQKLRENDMKFK